MEKLEDILQKHNVIMWLVWSLILVGLVLPLPFLWIYHDDLSLNIFWTLFVLRYSRFLGHIIGYTFYQPSPVKKNHSLCNRDVTVILPTVDPKGPDFIPCVESILKNEPKTLLVVTVGLQLLADCDRVLGRVSGRFTKTCILTSALPLPSKRRQVAHAMPFVKTPATILVDDHVFWPDNFLSAVLAPFENPRVGVISTRKRVRRTTPGKWSWHSIVNLIACNYLERHNWELRASNAINGGVFVVSGRTAAYRTSFLRDSEMLTRFCHESFFCGLFGKNGLGPDDDNFLTREAMKKGWLIRFQDTPDATIETTLGEWPKFRGQVIRWGRTTFRSNPALLRDPGFFARYTWSYFMVYWAGIINFALLWDTALIMTLSMSSAPPIGIWGFVMWLILTKTVKVMPQLLRHPADIPLVIFQFAFAYAHSLLKLWALLTFWDCDWSGRNLDELNKGNEMKGGTPFRRVLTTIEEDEE